MSEQYGIVANLERCVGCYACEVACRVEHKSAPGTPWIKVHTVGPQRVSGTLRMEYLPMLQDDCNLCRHRRGRGQEPLCVSVCPTRALQLCQTQAILSMLRNDRQHVCGVKEVMPLSAGD